jgi:hypothetical protein
VTDVEKILEAPDQAARDAKIKRDQWGRYLLPHPDTGKQQAWTRVTTFASTLKERYALNRWEQRNLVRGLASRPDLVAQAASCRPDDDDTLGGIVGDALAAAASSASANIGTAIHRFAERVDADELGLAAIPLPDIRDTLVAYVDTLDAAGIEIMPEWIERIVLIPELGVAGTLDRLVNSMWPLPRVADLKTGKNILRFGMTAIPLQLALYAHATHYYDPVKDELGEMPAVDQKTAVVMHVPAGQARCDLYEVDIAVGWDMVLVARMVRDWRKRDGNDLAKLITPLREQPSLKLVDAILNNADHHLNLADRIDWIRARVQAIKDYENGRYLPLLKQLWAAHPDVPTFLNGGPTTDEQVDIIAVMCDTVEADSELPFPPPDPTQPTTTKANRR